VLPCSHLCRELVKRVDLWVKRAEESTFSRLRHASSFQEGLVDLAKEVKGLLDGFMASCCVNDRLISAHISFSWRARFPLSQPCMKRVASLRCWLRSSSKCESGRCVYAILHVTVVDLNTRSAPG
jgi:hypothetical protein